LARYDTIISPARAWNYILTPFQELAEVTTSPPEGVKISLVDESNLHNWNVTMDGPEGSPYAVSSPNFHKICYGMIKADLFSSGR